MLRTEEFLKRRERDRLRMDPRLFAAMTRWEVSPEVHKFQGLDSVKELLSFTANPSYAVWNPDLGWEIPEAYVRASEERHREVLGALFPEEKQEPYTYRHADFYNATDFFFQNIQGREITRVLDFGAGYGRQSLLWTKLRNPLVYVGMDAIEAPYLVQNAVYRHLSGIEFREYMDAPESFRIAATPSAGTVVYHVPTWRADLLPERFFDLIICSHILQELNERTVRWLIPLFTRTVRDEGALYIRDQEFWRPAHRLHVGKMLLAQGWRLAWRFAGEDRKDINGNPRLWSAARADNSRYFSLRFRLGTLRRYLRSRGSFWDDLFDVFLPV
ncbi:MAG: hypothetical protein HY685_06970 [Chloroflexi bacterium]|nr:hypothetical protein [Chloroflexota bacterium]